MTCPQLGTLSDSFLTVHNRVLPDVSHFSVDRSGQFTPVTDARCMTTPSPLPHCSSEPTVVTCTTTAEFLSTLPLLLGYVPEQSVVITMFEKKQAKSAARFDIPPLDEPLESSGLDRAVVSLLQRHAWVTGVAVTIYTPEQFHDQLGAPHALLAMWLERALEMYGFPVRDLACVAADGWARYRSANASQPPLPLTSINHRAHFSDSAITTIDTPPKLTELGALPDPDESLMRLLSEALAEVQDSSPDDWSLRDLESAIEHCRRALTEPLSDENARSCAVLVNMCASLDSWVVPALILGVHTDDTIDVSVELLEMFLTFIQSPKNDGPTASNDLVRRLTLFSSERIEHEPLRVSIQKLTALSAHTPRALQPGILALTAWGWWMGGMSTPAQALLHEAEAVDAHHPAVTTVTELYDSGLPLWAYATERD